MKNEIVKYVTPNVVAPFGPPAGWGMAQICLKKCGKLLRSTYPKSANGHVYAA